MPMIMMYLKMNCTNVLVVVYGVILLICNNDSRNELNAAKCTFFSSVFICWRMMRGVSFSSKEETTHLPLKGSFESRAIRQNCFLEFKPHLTFRLTFCRTLNTCLTQYFPARVFPFNEIYKLSY